VWRFSLSLSCVYGVAGFHRKEGVVWDILVEESEGSLWAAALLDGRLDGLEVDPAGEEVRWGSIYWARVKTVDKGLDAVFLDLDGDNTGILYNRDVRVENQDGRFVKGGAESITKILRSGDMVAVQAKSAYLPKSNDQVRPREDKIPQMSMDITLPGRYLVYSHFSQHNKISTRIRDKKQRQALLKMMSDIEGVSGFILRSAAAGLQTDILVREAHILYETWIQMQTHLKGSTPGLIMMGPDAIQRILGDHAVTSIDRIEVVIMDHYHQVEEWCNIFAPDLIPRITPIEIEDAEIDFALFGFRDIMGQIESLFYSYSVLPHGGHIIMQDTAALTAVDVNKSSDKRGHLSVNIEAAKEIARQMRLRNTGGIVVVDFLKMHGKKDQDKLIAALEDAVAQDPCTVQIHGMTALGLVEVTRKRRTPPLQDRFDDNGHLHSF